MAEMRMGTAEAKFADIIWNNEPISSSDLAKLANKEFEWKKTTSFTVLKRLCERGLFQNQNGTVTSLISRKEFYARHSEKYVEEAFGGSLPAFLTAFGTRKKLTDKEIDEITKIIDSMRGRVHAGTDRPKSNRYEPGGKFDYFDCIFSTCFIEKIS